MPVIRESASGYLFKERTFNETLSGDVLSGPIQLITGGYVRAGTLTDGVVFGHITGGMGIVGIRSGEEQWRALSTNGEIMYGGGSGVIDINGISVYNSGSRLAAFLNQAGSWWGGGYTGISDISVYDDIIESTGKVVLSSANKVLGTQKLYNGDFAAGQTGWTGMIMATGPTNLLPYILSAGKGGGNAVVLYGASDVSNYDSVRWVTNGALSASAGKSYELQFDISIETATYPHASVKAIWTDGGSSVLRTDTIWMADNQVVSGPAGSWRRVICRLGPAPTSTAGVKIAFDAQAPLWSETPTRGDYVQMYIDNASLSEITNLSELALSTNSINLNGNQVRTDRSLLVGFGSGLTGVTGAGNIHYAGQLMAQRNSTAYVGSTFVPLTSPLTSTAWDGDAFSTTAKTLIDLSAVFGVPAGVRAVLVNASIRDSGSASALCNIVLGPTNTANIGITLRAGGVASNDYYISDTMIVPCDSNGDIYYQITATGTSTMDVILQIHGYWI